MSSVDREPAPEERLWRGSPPRFRNIVAGSDLAPRFRYDRDWVLHRLRTDPALERFAKFLTFLEDHPDNPYVRAVRWSGLADGAVVLDYGCAIAWASVLLKRLLPRLTYIGADINPLALASASVLYPEADHLYQVPLAEPSLSHLRDDSVDLVILSLITRYEGCREFMAEFERVLRPGGHLHIETHAQGLSPDAAQRGVMADRLAAAFEPARVRRAGTCGTLAEFRDSVAKRKFLRRKRPCRLVGTFRLI